ncbi:MAG: hypothetical protein MAG551_00293 [Candidatus Scalindua arabica]|uniref:Uncharacterized protein n=1 Tax=Candidatus Scalindua arabica TaxID=1127984 RepID=A0A941W183_9BACT|nr:hypothetical protein [Candidatus Scalindua arabica]
MKATVAYGTVVWTGNIDIALETLWKIQNVSERKFGV